MFSTLFTNILAFINDTSWYAKLAASVILWFTPAFELLVLLYAIIALDYLIDIFKIYQTSKPQENVKKKMWDETKIFLSKVIWYGVLALLLNGLQIHLLKDSFDLYRWMMAIPIMGEAAVIITTIETYTGVKLVQSFLAFVKGVFRRNDIDENIVDDAIDPKRSQK